MYNLKCTFLISLSTALHSAFIHYCFDLLIPIHIFDIGRMMCKMGVIVSFHGAVNAKIVQFASLIVSLQITQPHKIKKAHCKFQISK